MSVQKGGQLVETHSGFSFRKIFKKMDLIGARWSKVGTLSTFVEILYLQYFYVVVYSDGGWLKVCSPMICSTSG
jgi:hypothetical protein